LSNHMQRMSFLIQRMSWRRRTYKVNNKIHRYPNIQERKKKRKKKQIFGQK
jgi:hypothetical protein